MCDCIIIGAGPAGLTAAIYLIRENKKIKILEKESIGGKIASSARVENYPGFKSISGAALANSLYEQVTNLGGVIDIEEVQSIKNGKIKEVITDEGVYETKSIIIATGTHYNTLNLDMEEKYLGNGISFCTVCDGAFYKDKVVAVVGGANTAIINAIYLSSIAKTVYLIVRSDTLKGEASVIDELLEKDNIKILYESNVIKYLGDDTLTGIVVKTKDGEQTLEVSGVFMSIGQIPETKEFSNLIELDSNNYIKSSEECTTNIPGIFVAGDVREKRVRQLTTAMNDGTIAALNVIDYLKNIENYPEKD